MKTTLVDLLNRLLGAGGGQEQTVELRFGTDLTQQAVEAVLAAIAGLPRSASVRLETLAREDGLRHFLCADQATVDTISAQIRALAPSTRLEPARRSNHMWGMGARLAWSPPHPLLRVDAATEAAVGVLAALAVAPGEALLLQLTLRPGLPLGLPSGSRERPRGAFASPRLSPQVLNGLRAKNAGALVRGRVVCAVACGHPGRGAHLLGRVAGAFRARRGGHGRLLVRRLSARGVEAALRPLRASGELFSPPELAGLIGWPIGAPQLQGLALGTSPLLPPDTRIPESGRLLGVSTWPPARGRVLAQPLVGALSHSLICGPTGSGKSSLAANLIASDIREGRGCLVLDGKGDLVADVLTNIPPERVEDVVVLDPASGGSVPGLRVFGHGADPELAADLVLGVLRELFKDSWGVRSSQWLRAGLVLLGHDPGSSLGDLPYVFSDDRYRQRLRARVDDPLLLATWAAFEAMKPAERSNQLGAPLNKLSELLGRRVLRTVLSQTKPTLDVSDAMRRNRIVLVSLSPGRLGTPAARLLGALVAHSLFTAVQARAADRPSKRTPFLAYIDEPKVLGDIPVPLDGLFELARGMGIGIALLAQSLKQLPPAVSGAALTNAATLVAFRQSADDAELLARELPGVTAEGLQHLGEFEIITRVGLGPGAVSAPASARTLPPPPVTSNPTAIRLASAERYGTDPKQVDRELAARHTPANNHDGGDEAAVGRKRRTP